MNRQRKHILIPILLCSALTARADVQVNEGGKRPYFNPQFFGVNGYQTGAAKFDWDTQYVNSAFQTNLVALNPGYLRGPTTGTPGNYWDGSNGQPMDFTASADWSGPFADSTMSYIINTTLSAVGTKPLYIVNMLTQPPHNNSITAAYDYTPGSLPGSGGLSDTWALADVSEANTDFGVTHFELGNEFYFTGNQYNTSGNNPTKLGDNEWAYTNGGNYGTVAKKWISDMRKVQGTQTWYLAAVAATHDPSGGTTSRQNTWNQDMFPNLGTGEDAVTVHIYPTPNLPPNTPNVAPLSATHKDGTATNSLYAKDLIASIYSSYYDNLSTNIFNQDSTNGIGTLNAWITETNIHVDNGLDTGGANMQLYTGTWAHGLALGAVVLRFLEQGTSASPGPSITMLIHHDLVDEAAYGDMFCDTSGLAAVSNDPYWNGWATPPATGRFGFTASGLVMEYIDTAAIGKSAAAELTFTGYENGASVLMNVTDWNPTDLGGVVTVPRILAWEFGTGPTPFMSGNQCSAVFLNLDSVSHTLAIGTLCFAGSYWQLYTDPGYYITGLTTSGGVTGGVPYAADYLDNSHTIQMSQVGGVPLGSTLVLPPFSVTRLSFQHL